MTAVVKLFLTLGIIINVHGGPEDLESVHNQSAITEKVVNLLCHLAIIVAVGGGEPVDSVVFEKPDDTTFYQCHNAPSTGSAPAAPDTAAIDAALKDLYDSITVKDADYEEDCTYSLKITGQPDTEVEMELAMLFERFEQLRNNYKRRLWGYCADKGAEYLTGEIKKLKDAVNASNNENNTVRICDRSKLLGCHRKYNKCKCLVDNKNFRNIAAEYWNDTEKPKDEKIGKSQCVLVTGSDCNFLGHGDFRCIPGNKCRYKDNKKLCKLPRVGYDAPEETASPDYSFTNYKYSNIYCQCYSYYTKGASLIAPQLSWTIVAILLTKYLI